MVLKKMKMLDRKHSGFACHDQHISNLLINVIENSRDIFIYCLDPQYRYLFFNSGHKSYVDTQWDSDIKIGQCILDIWPHSNERRKAIELYDRALSGEHIAIEQSWNVTQKWWDNHNVDEALFKDIYSPIFNNNGEIIGLSAFVIDISAKKIEQQILKSYQGRLEKIVEQRTAELKLKQEKLISVCPKKGRSW